MHDPFVVAFELRRPWPQRSADPGRRFWLPPLITVWHREPGGHDSGEVCKHWRRGPNNEIVILHAWKWHVHHWRIQLHPLLHLRRTLLTRCTWCGGRQRKGDPVNVSHSWDGPRGRWWQGEPGLYHRDCSSVAAAWRTCVCEAPICPNESRRYGTYGRCLICGKPRPIGTTPQQLARLRLLADIPKGQRDRAVYERVCQMVEAEREGAERA